jgi:diguanylate cyclase (GGDEF)-like protein
VPAVLELGGAPCQFEIGAKPILWAGKYEVGVLWQLHDVTESKRLEAELLQKNRDLEATVKENEALQIQLKEQAIHDPLTGLYNRRYLDEMIAHDLSLAIRTGTPVAIAMVDIDHFKQVNDQFGHQAGDQVLKELAILLTGGTRKSDMVCRYGGEEFLIALYGSTVEQAGTQLDELRRKFAQLVTACGELRITATLSAGIAGCPRHSDSAETLISRADAALYEAKRMGRNQVRTAAD